MACLRQRKGEICLLRRLPLTFAGEERCKQGAPSRGERMQSKSAARRSAGAHMKTTADEKRTTRELYNLYKADAGALRSQLRKLRPLEVAVAVLELAQQLPVQARERLLGDLRRWVQEDKLLIDP